MIRWIRFSTCPKLGCSCVDASGAGVHLSTDSDSGCHVFHHLWMLLAPTPGGLPRRLDQRLVYTSHDFVGAYL